MLTRRFDWQTALSDYVLCVACQPFQYGVMDCGLFVADAISAMTGVDVAADLRGYTNRTQAFEAIQRVCGRKSMGAIADHLAVRFGIPEIEVLFATGGDPVQSRTGRLGIVAMHGTELLTPSKYGLLRLPMDHAMRAWRI